VTRTSSLPTFAAVDLGAQSGRVALARFDGERLAMEEIHRFPNVPVRIRGTLHWDVLRLYGDVLDGLRAAARAADIYSVGVDSWGIDFGLLDSAGRLLQNPVHYRDSRRSRMVEGVLSRVAPRELYERTGIQLLPINTVFELAAMAADGDAALAAADCLLLIPDLFHYWLCGSRTTELTNATTTQCFDVRSGRWATGLLEGLGIPTHLLPEVVAPATRLASVSDETSGVAGATVVAGATHDTASAVVGAPLTEHAAFLSVGTWSMVGLESHEPFVDDDSYRANLSNEGGVEGTFRILRDVTGLWLLDECRRSWRSSGRERSLEHLLALAQSAPALRSLVNPDDPAFATPGDMPARIVDYCKRTVQSPPGDEGAIVRCILESLALKHAEVVDELAAVTGRPIESLCTVGGGVNNELLCAWTATAAGRPLYAGPTEATLVGNFLMQARALGELSSLADARAVVSRSFTQQVYEPARTSEWQEARERFASLSNPVAV
jgi:rhamnulokinase